MPMKIQRKCRNNAYENWKEKETSIYASVPLLLFYAKCDFNRKTRWGGGV